MGISLSSPEELEVNMFMLSTTSIVVYLKVYSLLLQVEDDAKTEG